MQRSEVTKLVSMIDLNYRGFVKDTDSFVDGWQKALTNYDYQTIEERLKKLMAMEQFQYQPPTLPFLVKDVPTIDEQKRNSKFYFSCNICKRLFKQEPEFEKHFSRCSSVRYVIRQTKKYFGNDISSSKRELYEMSDDEFNARYMKLVRHIHEHTENDYEKQLMEHIMNPPSSEDAKRFLKGATV